MTTQKTLHTEEFKQTEIGELPERRVSKVGEFIELLELVELKGVNNERAK